jgi:hypothetical protein
MVKRRIPVQLVRLVVLVVQGLPDQPVPLVVQGLPVQPVPLVVQGHMVLEAQERLMYRMWGKVVMKSMG